MTELTRDDKVLLFKALCTHINFLNHNILRPDEEQDARDLRVKLAQIMAEDVNNVEQS